MALPKNYEPLRFESHNFILDPTKLKLRKLLLEDRRKYLNTVEKYLKVSLVDDSKYEEKW